MPYVEKISPFGLVFWHLVGGFSLAARWTGAIETVAFVEIDEFCKKVLKKHWPNTPIISDIREVTGERIRQIVADTTEQGLPESRPAGIGELQEKDREGVHHRPEQQDSGIIAGTGCDGQFRGKEQDSKTIQSRIEASRRDNLDGCNVADKWGIDILTAGVPCQPASCAGKRKGTGDDRWLWPETFRVISEVKPTWCILENVRGLISLEGGLVFDGLLSSLEALGYEVQSFIIPACAVNAPHRRDRVWIVAKSNGGRKPQSGVQQTGVFAESDRNAPDTRNEGLQGGEWPGAYDQGQTAHGSASQRNSAWDEPWLEVATRLCGISHELPDELDESVYGCRHDRVARLKALGNAIVPSVAYPIFQAIVDIERGNHA
jgi:DNA (cytosine-5)-methyltransferase 1